MVCDAGFQYNMTLHSSAHDRPQAGPVNILSWDEEELRGSHSPVRTYNS